MRADRSSPTGFAGRGPSEHGFTLIEVMVALAVFSLAVMALVRLESATVRGAGTLDQTLIAQIVARNVAIDAMTGADAPTAGIVSGSEANGGRLWHWTRQVTPTGDVRIVKIDVAVADARGTVLGRMTLVRPATVTASVARSS